MYGTIWKYFFRGTICYIFKALPGGIRVARLDFQMSYVGDLSSILPCCRKYEKFKASMLFVAIRFPVLLLLFGPCHLLEFTLAGPRFKFTLAKLHKKYLHYLAATPDHPRPRELRQELHCFGGNRHCFGGNF